MFSKLSFSQKRIVVCNESRIIIKACPGSGKTFSVTARLARILRKNKLNKHQGIAVLSFTNTACLEIFNGLKNNFGVNEIGYPHFLGTIDSFINNYIFLPFGHLEMKCNERPEIVGSEFNEWFEYDSSLTQYLKIEGINKVIKRDPNYYFDKVSFKELEDGIEIPIPLNPPSSYHFSWNSMYKRDGTFCQKIQEIINSKHNHFSKGKANQADAIFFANRILKKYPSIAKSLVKRFPILIIDEAQDTTEVQMDIIDMLDKVGLDSLTIIGDPDQAIFEWNSANSDLFIKKWEDKRWFKLQLLENRRSSAKICKTLNSFFQGNMCSISKYKDYTHSPQVLGYNPTDGSILEIYCKFIDRCNELLISEKDVAVVYRGKSFGEKYFGIISENTYDENLPWENKNFFVRDIILGKYLMEKGLFKAGFKLAEKGYHKWKTEAPYISSSYIKEEVNRNGFKKYRQTLFTFYDTLPSTLDRTVVDWVKEAKEVNGFEFKIKNSRGKILISSLFHSEQISNDFSFINTIHSVKGKSLDAILVFLTKKDRSNYSTLLDKEFNSLNSENKEQIKVVYVACSRPRKILWLAVPEEDVDRWSRKLNFVK